MVRVGYSTKIRCCEMPCIFQEAKFIIKTLIADQDQNLNVQQLLFNPAFQHYLPVQKVNGREISVIFPC